MSPTPHARPRAAHLGPQARRPLVLDAAQRVWNTHGPAGVTMAAIAAEAQVSKPVLYACYADKDAVLLALLEREEARLLEAALSALPRSVDPADPLPDVTSAYRAFFQTVLDHPLSWRVVFDAQRGTTRGVPDVVGRRYRAARDGMVAHVAALVGPSGLAPAFAAPHELLIVAEHVVALAEVNAWHLLQPDTPWQADTLADVVARLLLGGAQGQVTGRGRG